MTLFDDWILSQFDTVFSAVSLLAVILGFFWIQTKREQGSVSEALAQQPAIGRYAVYIVMVVLLVFGFVSTSTGLGNGGFIYGEF